MPGRLDPARGVIHIALVGVPGLMEDLVTKAILEQPDMSIENADDFDIAGAFEGIDVVVTSLAGSHVPDRFQRLLFEYPSLALVAISQDGRRLEVYDHQIIREVAPDQLVEAIRQVAHTRNAA